MLPNDSYANKLNSEISLIKNGHESVQKLMDAFTEGDVEDPDFGPPENWPSWTDQGFAVLVTRLEMWHERVELDDDEPCPDSFPTSKDAM